MKQKHKALAEAIQQSVELDHKQIAKVEEIIEAYKGMRKALTFKRATGLQMLTAIKHGDEARLKMLAPEWRDAVIKVGRYKI